MAYKLVRRHDMHELIICYELTGGCRTLRLGEGLFLACHCMDLGDTGLVGGRLSSCLM